MIGTARCRAGLPSPLRGGVGGGGLVQGTSIVSRSLRQPLALQFSSHCVFTPPLAPPRQGEGNCVRPPLAIRRARRCSARVRMSDEDSHADDHRPVVRPLCRGTSRCATTRRASAGLMLAPERVFSPDAIAVAVLQLCDGNRSVGRYRRRAGADLQRAQRANPRRHRSYAAGPRRQGRGDGVSVQPQARRHSGRGPPPRSGCWPS